ncbi:hypothetical protein [Mycolicibacterium fortuitum]|uniref:hypothetical protein n=1 Tax=Mycolicibacterium fortuitum TaxID=1766 RepID=UPI003AAE933F
MEPTRSREIESATAQVHVEPDLEAVADALVRTRTRGCVLSPEQAWANAVSGNTAAQMAGVDGLDKYMHWDETAVIIAKAAAYGWWPATTPDGRYVAMPIDQWIADGHPYTRIVPNLDSMLDRWGIAPVVIDAETDDHTPQHRNTLPQ